MILSLHHHRTKMKLILAENPLLIDHTERRNRYAMQLTRQEWAHRRAGILKRDGNCCRQCGAHRGLQVHHRQYHVYRETGAWLEPWAYADKHLVALCEACHQAGHFRYKVPVFIV